MLIAFVGLIALINGMLGGIGGWFGMPELTLELILGYAFSPLAFLIGVPMDEAIFAGSFIGQKLVVNEFVAYLNFTPYIPHLGGLGSLAPSRRSDIARMGVKAVLAGTLSNLMAATIAGFCLTLSSM